MWASDVTVVIPSLNPDEKLAKTVDALIALGFSDILLINDGSKDECVPNFPTDRPECTLLTHEVNRGKGAAMKTAFRYYLDSGRTTAGVITVDGDGQHLAEDVLRCAESMCENRTVVLGVRDFSDPTVPPRSRMGNRITSLVFRLFCGIRLSDTQTGLRAIPREHLPEMLQVDGDRYEYETNMLLRFSALDIAYCEETIHTVYIEENKTSHFRPVRDSIRIYGLILKFISSSIIASIVDQGLYFILATLLFSLLGVWTDTVSAIAARIVSSGVNFLINQKAVFKSRASGKTAVVRYYILAVGIMILSAGSISLFSYLMQMSSSEFAWMKTLVKAVIDIILSVVSFRLQREWVFSEKSSHNLRSTL